MRYVLQLSILLAAFGISTALASDRLRLAQAVPVPGQIAPQGQVLPAPLLPTPLISSQTSTACLVACDTQVMNCQNACVVVGPTTGTLNPWQFALHSQLHDPTARLQTGVHQAAGAVNCHVPGLFKLAEAAEKSWRRLDGYNQLPKVILGVKFTNIRR